MSLITFVPVSSAPTGVIKIADGVTYDVGAGLSSGGGSIVVDNVANYPLYEALLDFPGLEVSGSSGGSGGVSPTYSRTLIYKSTSPTAPVAGELLLTNGDGTVSAALIPVAINYEAAGTWPARPEAGAVIWIGHDDPATHGILTNDVWFSI